MPHIVFNIIYIVRNHVHMGKALPVMLCITSNMRHGMTL